MIAKEESIRADGVVLETYYSNQGVYIKQVETGATYDKATDIAPSRYTYLETDEPIETPEIDPVYGYIRPSR